MSLHHNRLIMFPLGSWHQWVVVLSDLFQFMLSSYNHDKVRSTMSLLLFPRMYEMRTLTSLDPLDFLHNSTFVFTLKKNTKGACFHVCQACNIDNRLFVVPLRGLP